MTRLNSSIPLPPKPATVSLCELAIAAGMAGQSVAIRFQDFPAHIVCQIWKYSMHFAEPNTVYHVRNQPDVRKLPPACGDMRLVLVYTEKYRTASSWAVEMASSADTEAHARPAIFSIVEPGHDQEDPGVALLLRANPVESAAVARWLTVGQVPAVPNWQAIARNLSIVPTPALIPVLSPGLGNSHGGRQLHDQDLLRSLVIGAAVLRSLEAAAEEAVEIEELTLTVDDYGQVRRLLQFESVTPADEVCDPLAKDMVDRANVFLQAKYAEPNAHDNSFNTDGADSPPGHGPNRDLITRREVADLGNLRSDLVLRLVEFLRRRHDGYERFLRMGLVRQPPRRDRWQNVEGRALVNCLRPWSAKQVRTHFDPLRCTGLIAAERETTNGPWRYTLPEELQVGRGTYRGLPTAAELAARQPVG